jgi:UDP-N-acetylmuramoyl-tripeptide--D-alanyl-D-alanine ligase
MRDFALRALKYTLKRLAQLTIWRYRPGIIGVTGNVGKTSAKIAIAAVLGHERKVRWSHGNLNNELGLPLTILGNWGPDELFLISRANPAGTQKFAKAMFWLRVIVKAVKRLIVYDKAGYPEILVLEYGADRPGDLKYLLSFARPNVSIITAVGDIPVHVEYFGGPQELAREKARLIECLPSAGFAVLNYDDPTVMNLKDRTRATVMTYGFSKGADIQIVNFEHRLDGEIPVGISFKLQYGGHSVPVRIERAFGRTQAYAAAAAASVGIVFGLNLIKISEALKSYIPADSRMQLLPGIKDTLIVNDAYNASPMSMQAALESLKILPGKRKVAILGDMLELGKFAMEAHERIGRLAGGLADVIVTVGPRAKFIADEARKVSRKRNITSYDDAESAKEDVKNLLRKGDLVIVKGSRAMHLERIIEGIQAPEPEQTIDPS